MRKVVAAIVMTAACCFLRPSVPIEKAFGGYEGQVTVCVGAFGSDCKFVKARVKDIFYLKGVVGACVENADEKFISDVVASSGAEKVFEESVSDTVTTYYYSPQISVYKSINGKKVNLQTASTNCKLTIGIPMIFGGF